MREASGKSLRGLDIKPGESEGHRAWWLTLVWKESKNMKLAGTAPFFGKGEGRATVGAACTSRSLWDKRAKCFLWTRMDARESSRTWAAIKGPCPGGHLSESGDSNSKDQNQGQPEGASPLPGNSATKNTSHVPCRGLQSHMTTLVINFTPSLPPPHLTVTLRSE